LWYQVIYNSIYLPTHSEVNQFPSLKVDSHFMVSEC
jgi:hypothetical protein